MRTFVWLIVGFGLFRLAKLLESFGDMEPYAATRVSWDRLSFHGAALVVLLAGLACFVRAGVLAYRAIRGVRPAHPKPVTAEGATGSNIEAEMPFDPDAALAHYLQTKGQGPSARLTRPRAPSPGFGRRGG